MKVHLSKTFVNHSAPLLLLAVLVILSNYPSYAATPPRTENLDLGFPAPGEISFQLDRYVEEWSYTPKILNATFFKNWKRTPASFNITDLEDLKPVGLASLFQGNEIGFIQALRSNVEYSYLVYTQQAGDSRLFESLCTYEEASKSMFCNTPKQFAKKGGVIGIMKAFSVFVLLRQDRTKNKDVIEIYQESLEKMYAYIELQPGTITPEGVRFKEIKGKGYLYVLKSMGESIDIYEIKPTKNVEFQQDLSPDATILAVDLGVVQIDALYIDEFNPYYPLIREGSLLKLYNASNSLTANWVPLCGHTPLIYHQNSKQNFSIHYSFPKILLVTTASQQVEVLEIQNLTKIREKSKYRPLGCSPRVSTSGMPRSQFSPGQNLLYVDCATANASYIVAFDTERNYQENNKNFNYWLSGSDANLRKLVKVDTTKKIDFTVVPFDAVSDLVFYAANGEFSSYRLFHHYQVSGKSTTGQYCTSISDYDCFYQTYIEMKSDWAGVERGKQTLKEEILIYATFAQENITAKKSLNHSSWINSKTTLDPYDSFDGTIFDLNIDKPEDVKVSIKGPLELLKEISYKGPESYKVVHDVNTNQEDKIFMIVEDSLQIYSLTSNSLDLIKTYRLSSNCREVYPVPNMLNFVVVCYLEDQRYNVTYYQVDSLTYVISEHWSREITSHAFRGKMTPDGKNFYVLFDSNSNNTNFIEIMTLDMGNGRIVPHAIPFPRLQNIGMNLYKATDLFAIQAFDVALNQALDSYIFIGISNRQQLIICRTAVDFLTNTTCKDRKANFFQPRAVQVPEQPIFNQLEIINETRFIINSLNSYAYHFNPRRGDQNIPEFGFKFTTNADIGLSYYANYPKYDHIEYDHQGNTFLIANNATGKGNRNCVIFMYANQKYWPVADRGHVQQPLEVLSQTCPFPTYSPKIMMLKGDLFLVDYGKFSLYKSQKEYTLKLESSGMFEPDKIELPVVLSNDYSNLKVVWTIYGNLLHRPVNYLVWIIDVGVWLLVLAFFWKRRSGVSRQLAVSLNKYFNRIFRKAVDLTWEFVFLVAIVFMIYMFGLLAEGSTQNAAFVFFLVLSFNSVLQNLVVIMVQEKQEKLKEYLKICGMKMSTYILSFLIVGLIKGSIIGTIVLLVIWWVSDLNNIFWLLLGLVPTIASMSFRTLLFSSFFNRHRTAAAWTGIIFAILSCLVFVPRVSTSHQSTAWICSIFLPEIGFGLGVSTTGLDETFNYEYSIMDTIKLNTLGALVYFLSFLYFDQILPNEYGIRKSMLFCLPRYPRNLIARLTNKVARTEIPMVQLHEIRPDSHGGDDEIEDASSARFHQRMPDKSGLRRSILVDTMRKVFTDAVAVNNLSFIAYEQQILCFLGHNGSGKSTLINLLAGMYNPDFGDIKYGLMDFKEYFSEIRAKIGYCASTDVLYNYLTVEETLRLIGEIKGVQRDQLNLEINDLYEKLGLLEERDTRVKHLTKSQKRKLSLALAFLGSRNYILLDEPTADLDLRSKRRVWEALREFKTQGKTIIIATKDAAEVEALADRVAVLSNGQIFALGSVDYVKEKLEVGYRLFITPKSDQIPTEEFLKVKENAELITKKIVPAAVKEENTPPKVLQFGFSFKDTEGFGTLFEELEKIPQIKVLLELVEFKDAFANLTFLEEKYTNSESYNSWLEESFGLTSDDQLQPFSSEFVRAPAYDFFSQLQAMMLRRLLYAVQSPVAIIMYGTALLCIICSGLFAFQKTLGKLEDSPWAELYTFGFWNIVFWAILLPTFAAIPVLEREDRNKIRDMLRMQGLGSAPYWLSALIIDMHIALTFLVIQLIAVYFIAPAFPFVYQYLGRISLTTYLYALLSIAWAYFIGYFFEKASQVYRFLGLTYFFIGFFLGYLLLNTLWMGGKGDGLFFFSVKLIYYLLFPVGPYAESLFHLHLTEVSMNSMDLLADEFYGAMLYGSYWHCILHLFISFLFYFFLSWGLDELIHTFSDTPEEAEPSDNATQIQLDPQEIEKEKQRVIDLNNIDSILVKKMTKVVFEGPEILKELYFGVQKSTVMGILGPNQSHKTTLMNIISGLETRSYGTVKLKGMEQEELSSTDLIDVGIHTDHHPIWEHLTLKDHLKIYSLLKGRPSSNTTERAIDLFIQRMNLSEFKFVPLKQLSSQAKKKVALAMALIGSPSVVIIDDLSSLDLSTRKFVKEVLKTLVAERQASVLTTLRSMAEAETLCDKIAIIVNGRICSLGYVPQMKVRFAKSFKLTVIKHFENDGSLEQTVMHFFPDAALVPSTDPCEEVFEIPVNQFVIQKIFKIFNKLKVEEKVIKDFHFCNATLSQMLVYISQFQE